MYLFLLFGCRGTDGLSINNTPCQQFEKGGYCGGCLSQMPILSGMCVSDTYQVSVRFQLPDDDVGERTHAPVTLSGRRGDRRDEGGF